MKKLIFIRIILLPLTLLYSFIIFLRNVFYDLSLFKSYKISVPVISVGNISTGGTGKTPMTVFIAGHYLSNGLKVGIVSRGYKRKSKDLVIVCDGVSVNQDITLSGDEPVMISNSLLSGHKNNFFAVAGSDRVKASEFLISKFHPDVIILDDGFQHRRIERDIDVVLVDAQDFKSNVYRNLFTIPSGNLRESITNLKRAGIVIQNNKSDDYDIIPFISGYASEIISMRYNSEYIMDSKNSILDKENLKGINAFVFSGLADNFSFVKQIQSLGLTSTGHRFFPDHHDYTDKDIESLEKVYRKGLIYITTEKDFVKIKKFKKFVSQYPVYFLKIGIQLNDSKNILIKMLDEAVK